MGLCLAVMCGPCERLVWSPISETHAYLRWFARHAAPTAITASRGVDVPHAAVVQLVAALRLSPKHSLQHRLFSGSTVTCWLQRKRQMHRQHLLSAAKDTGHAAFIEKTSRRLGFFCCTHRAGLLLLVLLLRRQDGVGGGRQVRQLPGRREAARRHQ